MRRFYTRRSSPYTSAVAKVAIGRISTAATEPPIHSPQVSEPVTANPPNAPASMTASSKTTAKAAVKNAKTPWRTDRESGNRYGTADALTRSSTNIPHRNIFA
jgi:hypothetical protein